MWSEDEDIQAALRGDYAADPNKTISRSRILAGTAVLFAVAVFAIVSVIYFTPA